jgi:hypothetical protein
MKVFDKDYLAIFNFVTITNYTSMVLLLIGNVGVMLAPLNLKCERLYGDRSVKNLYLITKVKSQTWLPPNYPYVKMGAEKLFIW